MELGVMSEFGTVKTSLYTSWEISSLKVFSLYATVLDNLKEMLQITGIHFPFYSARTTLFSQPVDCSRSGGSLGLRSFFLGPNLLLHFNITLNGTKSETSSQLFLFWSCRQTRGYPHIRPRVRCWYIIVGILWLMYLNQYFESKVEDVSANFFKMEESPARVKRFTEILKKGHRCITCQNTSSCLEYVKNGDAVYVNV